MKIVIRIILILFLFNNSFNCYSQGKIDKSKNELNKDKKEKKDNNYQDKEGESSYSYDDDSSDDFFVEIITQAFLFVAYYSIIGDYEREGHLHNSLTEHPYSNNMTGNYRYSELSSENILRLELENSFLLSFANIYGDHLKAKFRPFQYFYLQSDYIQLVEFSNTDISNSYLSLFNLNFCYDRIRFEKINFGWILGMNYIGNEVNKLGFMYGLNTDIFLFKPISVYSSMRWGVINGVSVNEFEANIKYHKNQYFFSFGYENYKIGSPIYNFVSIGGGIYF